MEDEAEMMEDVLPRSLAKKRLVLTTQLMQQVFRPAPGGMLSADACSNKESVVYFVTRLALGDSCSLTSGFQKPPLTSDVYDLIFMLFTFINFYYREGKFTALSP